MRRRDAVTEQSVDKTLYKGLLLIELLSKSGRAGVSELAQRAELSKSNVHRLLQTLHRAGWVCKVEEDKSYELSVRAWEVAQNWLSTFDLPRIARPHLATLASATQETVHLGLLEDDEVVFIVNIESPQAVRSYVGRGGRAPAQAVATGRAILAFLPPEKMPILSPSLATELERTRCRGYAVNRGEWQEQVNGIAAPIYAGASKTVIAAVGLSGPADRLNQTAIRRYAPLVVAAAATISQAISAP
jgi:IclR family transcriptional regulator, KDG regulon repressor